MRELRFAFAGLILCAACTSTESVVPDVDDDSTLLGSLQAPAGFLVDGPASVVEVQVRAQMESEEMKSGNVDFTVTGGDIDLRADRDGNVVIHGVRFDLEDVEVPADVLPPDGLMLRELHVRLRYPTVGQLEWESDNTASGELSMHIAIDWSAEFGETRQVYPLRSIDLENLVVQANLAFGGDGQVVAHLSTAKQGSFWSWAQMFELTDLVIELDAFAD